MTQNAHEELLGAFPSAYRMAADTGIPSSTCKHWRRHGRLSDPSRWRAVWDAARCHGYPHCYAAALERLAEDYHG